MILCFKAMGIPFYVKVDVNRNLFGYGAGVNEWIPINKMFTNKEDINKLLIAQKIIKNKESLSEVKDYIVSEFCRDGVVFCFEVSDEDFEGVVGV